MGSIHFLHDNFLIVTFVRWFEEFLVQEKWIVPNTADRPLFWCVQRVCTEQSCTHHGHVLPHRLFYSRWIWRLPKSIMCHCVVFGALDFIPYTIRCTNLQEQIHYFTFLHICANLKKKKVVFYTHTSTSGSLVLCTVKGHCIQNTTLFILHIAQ